MVRKNLKLILESILFGFCFACFLVILFFGYLIFSNEINPNKNIYKSLISRSDSYLNEVLVVKVLNQIPKAHLESLIENDYKIIISRDVLFEKHNKYKENLSLAMNDLGGIAIHQEKAIILNENLLSTYFSCLHEIGHCIDKINNRPSKNEEFIKCFEKEKDKIRKYARKNESEYFADIYGLIYVNVPYFLYNINNFPLTYNYLENCEWF